MTPEASGIGLVPDAAAPRCPEGPYLTSGSGRKGRGSGGRRLDRSGSATRNGRAGEDSDRFRTGRARKAILRKLMKLGRETGNEHLVAYHPKTGRQIRMSSLGVQRRAGPASRLVPLDQVRVEISRRSVPKKLEGRYDEQSVAKSVELPLMELLVQLPAQPDPPRG